MITCTICTIGDELLIGQVVDTNSATLAKAVNLIGIPVRQMCTIGDNREDIISTIDLILRTSDILILTGGLGPTKDDITKSALAEVTGSKHYFRSLAQEAHIEEICKRRGNALFEINRVQADVPDSCSVLENRLGTAPGMWFDFRGKVIISLPGVPYEMEGILPQVLERLKERFSDALLSIVHRTISTIGIPESVLAAQIASWEDALPKEIHLAYLPNPLTGVRLRLSCYDASPKSIQTIDLAISKLHSLLGNAIYGYENETMEEVVASLLLHKQASLSTAESCTGGKIGSQIISLAGASRYYKGGVVAYDNKIKEKVLSIPTSLIDSYGAVSQPCVEAMASGVLQLFQTDYALATSGIAGPEGGTEEKPVGTLWVAIATSQKLYSKRFLFSSDRLRNIDRFTVTALNELRLQLIL